MKKGALTKFKDGLRKSVISVLAMRLFTKIFGPISGVVVKYSNTCAEKVRLSKHAIKISKLVEVL